jgi:hypothetical protein
VNEKLAKRFYESWSHQRGCSLTWDEVSDLLRDDAITTAICNAAADEPPGVDCLLPRMVSERWTWERFRRYLSPLTGRNLLP